MPEASDPRSDSQCTESLMGNETRSSTSDERTEQKKVTSDTLRRTPYIVILALLYSTITLFAWSVLCTLTHRPIGARSYGVNLHSESELKEYIKGSKKSFDEAERIYRAARFCQSLASVLAIPLTSVVSSCTAVAFLQQRSKQSWRNLTLRQSMALADKGWSDPVLITKLISGGWKQYGSIFLVLAILLNLIGASISPLQGIFVTTQSIKVPTEMSSSSLVDLPKWIAAAWTFLDGDNSLPTNQLRNKLITTGNGDPQFRLWSQGEACSNSSDGFSQACARSGQSTFGTMPNLSDPFWAQPPVGFQTGLWKQFAPRINFTTKHEIIPVEDFPKGCENIPGALYMHYANMTTISKYGNASRAGYIVDVCMPANQSHSPWRATRKRQDFSEELYIKMDLDWKWPHYQLTQRSFIPGNYSFKITFNTTAGYFELPNYGNDQRPGLLLDDVDDGLEESCGAQSKQQAEALYGDKKRSFLETSKNETETKLGNLVYETTAVMNKGPLLSTTLALFTQGSYLDVHHTIAQAYQNWTANALGGGCIDVLPLIKLRKGEDDTLVSQEFDPCVRAGDSYHEDQLKLVADYMWLFAGQSSKKGPIININYDPPSSEQIENTFTVAAFTAIDIWMQEADSLRTRRPFGSLHWNMGVDQQIPSISHAGMVLISFLLSIYLFSILALSLYVAWTPRWTNQFDSFTMMRIGSTAPDCFPLQLAHNPDEVKALDKLSGCIGSTKSDVKFNKSEYVYKLELGGETSLKGKRRYHCYEDEKSSGKPE